MHALQGDGVVDQTAIEIAAETLEVRYDLHKNVPLRGPIGETDTSWIVVAFAGGLDDATVACLREVIWWLSAAAGITGPEAYALASMAVSFRITQYANQAGSAYRSIPPKAVHAGQAGPVCRMQRTRQATGASLRRSVLLMFLPSAAPYWIYVNPDGSSVATNILWSSPVP